MCHAIRRSVGWSMADHLKADLCIDALIMALQRWQPGRGLIKKEHVHPTSFQTREEAKAAVFDYIEVFYNRQRLHSRIGYRTPVRAGGDDRDRHRHGSMTL